MRYPIFMPRIMILLEYCVHKTDYVDMGAYEIYFRRYLGSSIQTIMDSGILFILILSLTRLI